MQRVIEAIEVVKQPNRRQQFDDLAFVVILAQLVPEGVVHAVGIEGGAFSQLQRGFLGVSKIGAVAEVCQIVNLILAPAVPPCQGGVGGQSIFAAIELRRTYDDQFL